MSTNIKYECFDRFVFRCPLVPINNKIKHFQSSPIFKESILLASPDFYETLFNETKIKTNEDPELKTTLSLKRYLTRMTFRCTPFGLFAGCGIGQTGANSKILLKKSDSYSTSTRLDMDYLCALIQHLSNLPELAEYLKFHPNSSLYKLFQSYRYVEYKYINSKRKHFLSEVEYNTYLENILALSEKGSLKKDLIDYLIVNEIEREEACDYITSLIKNQILVSELDPGVTGNDLLQDLIERLKQINAADNICSILELIKDALKAIDKT